jgi:hypothetical protein
MHARVPGSLCVRTLSRGRSTLSRNAKPSGPGSTTASRSRTGPGRHGRELRSRKRTRALGKGAHGLEEALAKVGHSSTRTIERVYLHELRPVLRTGAERMSRILGQ